MDDLDHSMDIAENDWTSFYKDSEECSLPDPLLACSDIPVLSDSEDSTHTSDAQAVRQRNAPTESCVTVCGRKEDGDDGGHTSNTEETSTRTSGRIPQASRATRAAGVTTQSLTPDEDEDGELDPGSKFPFRSKFPSQGEKERWFVTVGYCPVRPRVKKKLRQKKTRKGGHMRRPEQVQTAERGGSAGAHEDKHQEEGGRELHAPSHQSSGHRDDVTQLRSSETGTEPTEATCNSTSTCHGASKERAESDEDSAGFFSVPGSDSESYLSADEPADPRDPENRPDEDGRRLADACGDQTHVGPAAPCGQPGSLSPPVPRLTVTPCKAADHPDTFAEAAGRTRPVYAMSAFWDEMEKVTINDILQLRMAPGGPPPGDGPAQSLADGEGCRLSDGGLVDTSDAADSDYFTQPDESKRDRSSCEFSTSDFDEEFWRVVGSSGSSSPDPRSQRASSSAGEDENGPMSSGGKQTLAPPQERGGQIPGGLVRPRQMTRSRSVRDVRALSTEGPSSTEDNSGVGAALLNPDRTSHPEVRPPIGDDPDLRRLQRRDERKPVPIFSCCRPTVRELTLPAADPPVGALWGWEGLREVSLSDRGCGPWGSTNPQTPVVCEGGASPAPSQWFEAAAPWRGLETTQATSGQRLFLSTLKQSDMCLACIALASWVLTSSDSEAADGWKAALLANVSALSAIRYLRQYVKRNPTHNDA